MTDESTQADEDYLKRLTEELFALSQELADSADLDGEAYLLAWRKLHAAKERYKALTGIYPALPPDRR